VVAAFDHRGDRPDLRHPGTAEQRAAAADKLALLDIAA
jgi:hypothetical protein